MPLGLNESEMERVDEVVATRRKVARGDNLFRNGDKFNALFAIRTGFSKHASPRKMVAIKSRASKWQGKSSVWMAS